MKKESFSITLIILCAYFCAYLTATIFRLDVLANILSPVGGLLAFGILLNTYLNSRRTGAVRITWLLFGLACLFWAFSDIQWAIYDFVPGVEPQDIGALPYLYILTNAFMLVSVIIFAAHKFRKWHAIQLFLDVVTISVSSMLMLWILFFNKKFAFIELWQKLGSASFLGALLDFTLFVGIAAWYFSVRKGKIPLFMRIVSSGILLFILTDLYYYYLSYHDLYVANSVIDAVFMAGLLMIAVGAGLDRHMQESEKASPGMSDYKNIGGKRRGILLLIMPVLAAVFRGFSWTDLFIFAFIIFVHESLSAYIQTTIKYERLLKREKKINLLLEERIVERTREIVDMNRELSRKNIRLDFLSKQDTVTSLYNRRCFIGKLEEMLATTTLPETVALLFIDLDRFKTINDTYGHGIGDQVLIEISKKLKTFNHKNSLLARLGGDEFVFAFRGHYEYAKAEAVALKIIQHCSEAIVVEQYTFHITLSVGISIYPFDARDCDTLMKNADIAMYQAKSLGYNLCMSFNSLLNEIIHRRNKLEILLKKADFNKEFELFYQPQFSIPDKRLVGIEAVLRWNNPEYGSISPNEFIPIAEVTNHIIPIGEWVMRQAIRQISKWNEGYCRQLKMGINISPKQLDNADFVKILQNEMEHCLTDSDWIDIEITESIAIEGEYRISEIASLFKGIGVSISVDDFGTGYSSLSYLKLFPFDRIKIDKSLIDTISSDGYDLQIVKAIIMLAKTLGIRTIAEGVELQEQFDLLAELGCEEVQGFLLGRPVSSSEFENTFLKQPVLRA